jgi:hypothetical protein
VYSLDSLQAPSVRKLVKEVKQRQPCYLTLVIYDKTEEPPVSARGNVVPLELFFLSSCNFPACLLRAMPPYNT